MKVGISCAGIGAGAEGAMIRAAAIAAEQAGFSAFWLADHVLFFEVYPESSYAYGELFKDSPIPDPYTPLAEPVVAMTWVAAATSTIEVGTSILILPQRNPVVLAKELATLDSLSGGRLALGVGVGWSKEEYGAVGAEWHRRGRNMDEHIALMRRLWREPVVSHQDGTFKLERACMNPKPAREVPILIGGESEPAMKRIARIGDGWLPAKLPLDEAAGQIAHLKDLTREQGRDPETLRILGPLFEATPLDDLKRLRDAGVTEFYCGVPPAPTADSDKLAAHIAMLGEKFVGPLADW